MTETVIEMTEEEVSHLASETEDAATQRKICTENLKVLEIGLQDLHSLDKHKFSLQSEYLS